jgi:hypothetical protein
MAITNTRLSTATSTPVFTAVGQQAITVMYMCNTSGSPAKVNVFCIDSGDSSGPSNENTIYSELEITANDTYVISTEKLILDNGDFIEVEANVADVITVTVSSIAV